MTTRVRTRVGQETVHFMTEKLIKEQQADPSTQPHEVTSLRFSFKQLSCISPLTGFTALTELLLDNNDITKIENLSYVPNLVRLDLSFNAIEQIEGLEMLTRLNDLSLYSNRISAIQNLDSLTSLQCLSVGKNTLSDLDGTVRTLRKIAGLRMVTLSGNPLSHLPDYESRILGFCPKLRYLDGVRVSPTAVDTAVAACSEDLVAVVESERRTAEQASAQEASATEGERVAKLGLPDIGTLFEFLLDDEGDARFIQAFCEQAEFSSVRECVERFRSKVMEQVESLVAKCAANKEQVEAEIAMYESAIASAMSHANGVSRDALAGYERKKQLVEQRLALPPTDSRRAGLSVQDEMGVLRDALAKVKTTLLEVEVHLSEGVTKAHTVVAKRLGSLLEVRTEAMGAGFAALREEENAFHGELNEAFNRLIEQRATENNPRRNDGVGADMKGGGLGGLSGGGGAVGVDAESDQLKQLYAMIEGREELLKMAHEAHEARQQKLFMREEVCVSGQSSAHEQHMKSLKEGEHTRHRAKICEVNLYVSLLLQDVASLAESGQ